MILFVFPSFWSASAAAEKKAVAIAEGQAAPFSGQLLSTDLAIALGLKADRCEGEIELAVKRTERMQAINTQEQVRLWEIDREAWEKKESVYQKALDEQSSFWASKEFGIILGVVGAVAAVIIADKLEDDVLSNQVR